MVYKEVGKELPEVWKPEKEGDFIEGIYAQKKENVGANHSNLYHIDVDGVLRSIWGSKVLDDKMCYISIGDKIKITYQGKEKGKEQDYHKYLVEKDEPEESSEDQPVE